jgi:hypothetical protein
LKKLASKALNVVLGGFIRWLPAPHGILIAAISDRVKVRSAASYFIVPASCLRPYIFSKLTFVIIIFAG